MTWRTVLLFAVLAFLAGASLGRKLTAPEIREVIREVKVKDTVVVTDEKKTITKRPDGTVVTEIEKRTDKRVESRTDTRVDKAPIARDYSVGAYMTVTGQTSNVQLLIDRRLFGDLWAGAYVRANVEKPLDSPEFGVGIRYEF